MTDPSQQKIDEILERIRQNDRMLLREKAKYVLPIFFDIVDELLCIISSDGNFVLVSSSWTRKLGWDKSEIEGKPFLSFVHGEDRQSTQEAYKRFNFGDDQLDRNYYNRYLKRDGGFVWLQWRPELNEAYKHTGFIVGAADVVTDENILTRLNDEAQKASNRE